mgnify:CR=1 FL=1
MEESSLRLCTQYDTFTGRSKKTQPVEKTYANSDKKSTPTLDPQIRDDIKKLQDTFNHFIDESNIVKDHIDRLDKKALKKKEITKEVFMALSPITPIRRISSLPDNLEEQNYGRAAGLVALAILNLPEDLRDLKNAVSEISSKVLSKNTKQLIKDRFPKIYKNLLNYKPAYDYKNFQHPLSFFRGTFMEPLLNLPGKYGKKISRKLYYADKTIHDTKFGQWLLNKFNIVEDNFVKTNVIDSFKIDIFAVSHKGGNRFTRLLARAMLRMPVLSILSLSLLELPAIIKSTKKGDTTKEKAVSTAKQIAKSGIFVTSISCGIGIFGALLSKKGPTRSLIGMGLGSVAGGLVSQKANKLIDGQE